MTNDLAIPFPRAPERRRTLPLRRDPGLEHLDVGKNEKSAPIVVVEDLPVFLTAAGRETLHQRDASLGKRHR